MNVDTIPLSSDRYLKQESLGYWTNQTAWVLYSIVNGVAIQVRCLDEFESDFIDKAIKATVDKMEQYKDECNVIYYPGELI